MPKIKALLFSVHPTKPTSCKLVLEQIESTLSRIHSFWTRWEKKKQKKWRKGDTKERIFRMKEKSITKVQKQYVTELNWIWPVIVYGDSPEIISSPVTRTSEPERLLFCRISVLNPWSVHWLISFTHTMQNVQRTSFYQCLPLPLMKLKSSKVLFRFAPPPPLAITSLKPRALTNIISNRTEWRFYKRGQSHRHLWHAQILLYFLGKITVLLPLFRFGFQRIINWTVLFPQYHV